MRICLYENKLNSISCYPAQKRLTSLNKDSFIHMKTDLFLGPAGLDPRPVSEIIEYLREKESRIFGAAIRFR
jgi:hypothetical protein